MHQRVNTLVHSHLFLLNQFSKSIVNKRCGIINMDARSSVLSYRAIYFAKHTSFQEVQVASGV